MHLGRLNGKQYEPSSACSFRVHTVCIHDRSSEEGIQIYVADVISRRYFQEKILARLGINLHVHVLL